MEIQEKLNFINEALDDLEYPYVHYDGNFVSILESENICFFINWYLKKLDPSVFDDYEVQNFGDILFQYGFCSKAKAENLINGKLSRDEEVAIFYKMMHYLKSSVIENEEDIEKTTIEDVDSLTKMDLNLFEMYGPLDTMTDEQRKQLIEQYKDEIKELEAIQNGECEENSKTLDISLKDDLEEKVQCLDLLLPRFLRNAQAFCEQTESVRKTNVQFHKKMNLLMEKGYENSKFLNNISHDTKLILNPETSKDFITPKEQRKSDVMHYVEDLANDVLQNKYL